MRWPVHCFRLRQSKHSPSERNQFFRLILNLFILAPLLEILMSRWLLSSASHTPAPSFLTSCQWCSSGIVAALTHLTKAHVRALLAHPGERRAHLVVDLSDGQFLIAMRCRCFLCNSDAMSMVFGHSYHRNRYNYFYIQPTVLIVFRCFFSNLRTDVWR